MRFAYADPPYLGCGVKYAKLHSEAMKWDDPKEHEALVYYLLEAFPDGWALSLHVPSLRQYLEWVPAEARIAAWVKPFASFKPGVTRAWTWEPVIFMGGREITREQPTWRDHIACPITLRKGLTGAKPWKFCNWVLDGLGFQCGDEVEDLFVGTGVMGKCVEARNKKQNLDFGLFA